MTFTIEKSFKDWKSYNYHNPFLSSSFLNSLEQGGSVSKERGQVSIPLKGDDWSIPLFEKTHSYGEYIFDWDWARAYQQYGVPYYPKWVSAIPFTPATTPKLIGNKEAAASTLPKILDLAKKRDLSGVHFLFIPKSELPYFEKAQMSIRHSFQYHWHNQNYENFDHFLSFLKKNKRKNIKKERNQIKHLEIQQVSGEELKEEHAIEFHQFYLSTINKKGAIPYLSLDFFKQVFLSMPNNVLYLRAFDQERPIAGALFFKSENTLYGRYWGTKGNYPALHFELCYYQGIQYAIENKLKTFEAGAQGEHKISRGFLPELTYSAHKLFHPSFSTAVEDFIEREKKAVQEMIEELSKESPFKKED